MLRYRVKIIQRRSVGVLERREEREGNKVREERRMREERRRREGKGRGEESEADSRRERGRRGGV